MDYKNTTKGYCQNRQINICYYSFWVLQRQGKEGEVSDFSFVETAAMIRVVLDNQPLERLDAIYVMAEAPDNVPVTLKAVAQEFIIIKRKHDEAPRVLVMGWDTGKFGYPGFTRYKNGLLEVGIEPELITVVPALSAAENTRTEALSLAAYLRDAGFERVLVVAPTVHQPRAFLTILAACLEEGIGRSVRLYNRVAGQPWNQYVTHQQGKNAGTMHKLLDDETRRIRAYHANGHVALGKEVFEYMDWRDANP